MRALKDYHNVYVYGCSDDLIEVDGAIVGEVNESKGKLVFNDGCTLLIEYRYDGYYAGKWKIYDRDLGTIPKQLHNINAPCADRFPQGITAVGYSDLCIIRFRTPPKSAMVYTDDGREIEVR